MKKQLLLLMMILLSLIGGVEATAHDIEIANADGVTIYYNWIKTDELSVTYRGDKSYTWRAYSGNIIIPETVEYNGHNYKVTCIGNKAFDECTSLTSVTIPNGVTTIDGGAFYNCYNLSSINIPNSVTTIGGAAFSECHSLTSIVIPENVKTIGYSAFSYCHNLFSIIVPENIKNIGSDAFNGTAWYNNQPDGLIYVGKVAYKYKGDMPENTNVVIKEGTLSISSGAFTDCSGLTSISIPNSVISIGSSAFSGTTWYENQPDGMVYLGKCVYRYKGNMPDNTRIVIDEGTLSISSGAFTDCRGLTSISIPNSVISIGSSAFENCSSLISVFIPNNITKIEESTFYGCSGLTSVTIPNNVTIIGSSAFSECSSLASVTIPNKVETIGSYAFSGCSEMFSISIPQSVTSIGRLAFAGCSSLVSITIPNNLGAISERAFQACAGLTSVNIPDGVKSIGIYAFSDCKGMVTATIPNSMVSIGSHAFLNCSRLTSITIPNSITNIGTYAFFNCNNLNTILIPVTDFAVFCKSNNNEIITNLGNVVKLIDSEGVEIKDFVIPNSVTSISSYTFNNCCSLTSVTIPNSVVSIDKNAFANCSGLTNMSIPNSVTSIGENAFSNCTSLSALIIPENLMALKKQTFYNCSGLKNITIPANVEVIYQEAFANCKALESVKAKPSTPPFLYDNSFSNFSIHLEVPKGCKEEYQAAQGWKNFTNISESDKGYYKLIYLIDNEEYKSYKIEEGSSITPEPTPVKEGHTFSGWSEIPEIMPAHDVTVTGTFSINSYKLTYVVDGEEYKSYELEYGTAIIPEAEPTKDGYTFSGWSEIPATMPTYDVTVTGTFSINSYKLTYMIDDKVYKEIMYEYGATITPEPQPEGDYATFEWTGLPQTMPAHDIVVYASYTSGIIEVLMTTQRNIRIYSPNGKKLDKLQKGLNIVVLDDGTVKKAVVK